MQTILLNDFSASTNVIVRGGTVMTIPSGKLLDIDFSPFNLRVGSGRIE